MPDLHWPVKIAGTGLYLPQRIVSNAELAACCGLSAGWIEHHNGVRQRHRADAAAGETASWMAAQAARGALANAEFEASELDLILNASGTPEQAIPDGAPLLQRQLGLGTSGIPCYSIHSTCLSFLAALEVSAAFLATGRYRHILVASSDVSSVGLDFEEPESATLLGDAAAAAVLICTPAGETSGIHHLAFATYGDGADFTSLRGAGTCHPPNDPATRPQDNLFHMDGRESLRLGLRHFPEFLENLRPGLSHGLDDIDLVIPHQPSRAALRSFHRVGIPDERVIHTLETLGNCIAASLPATLHQAIDSGRLARGQRVLLIGTGAGLSFGGAILTY